ncbi:alpha/beta hydrolase [Burkholderia sp. FERM BP-3421]|uniref:esterase/lipase family protein n=1 Tax=Burkholderia sp. FERM BP-3421 TaxID=1494466 RepID=UPI00235F6145|nr:hypothetical protein [Burkholderia sp. FERM BP-3421]WDD96534.1 alpha/beta hydrolase [Burkholderia sp. FERM BP-3421]
MTTSSADTCATRPVHEKARRRVPLQFDENGHPYFGSVASPESFRMRALCVMPPRHVIPVIFVPGIMGSNLKANEMAKRPGIPAWRPPNGIIDGLIEVGRRIRQSPKDRQIQMTPEEVEVDRSGDIHVPRNLYTLTKSEAERRGWGEIHLGSYGTVLAELEIALNEQYADAGTKDCKPLPVWEIAWTLKRRSGSASDEMVDVVDQDWRPVNTDVPPLSEQEFNRLDDYFYPVWACGYNWLESSELSSDRLIARIQEAIDWYKKDSYWISIDKVIVVTHSMGGMVARRAVQKAPDRILGVVHGVQPVGGAPVVYRRLRSGTEVNGWSDIGGAAAAVVMGWSAADVTCVMANSPGPLELLPTKHHPPGWLRFEQRRNGKTRELMPPMPISDPYAEIYAKRVQDVWWGMIDETLIDPANLAQKNNTNPSAMYGAALKKARLFHDRIKLDCHPVTFAHYGSDPGQVSFGRVVWTTSDEVGAEAESGLSDAQTQSFTRLGRAVLAFGEQKVSMKLENNESLATHGAVHAGDGTVALESGALIADATPTPKVFGMIGFDHSGSYRNKNVLSNVIYCIAKIVQLAPVVGKPSSSED